MRLGVTLQVQPSEGRLTPAAAPESAGEEAHSLQSGHGRSSEDPT